MQDWTYDRLQQAVRDTLGDQNFSLWDFVEAGMADGWEGGAADAFVDAIERNLRHGHLVVLIISDEIGDGLDNLKRYLDLHAGFHATIALVELSLWEGNDGALFVVPRVPMKTVLVERGIVRVSSEGAIRVFPPEQPGKGAAGSLPKPVTLSEEQFYEALEASRPGTASRLRQFLDSIGDTGITPEFRRSLILRWSASQDQQPSAGYVDTYGSVYLGDGYYWAAKLGYEAAGRAYLEAVASAIGATVKWPTAESSSIRVLGSDGKIVRIGDLLDHAEQWKAAIDALVRATQPSSESDVQSDSRSDKRVVVLDNRTCLEALAAFAPRLREAGASFGGMSTTEGGDGSPGNPIQMPYWDFSDLAMEFMDMAYKFGWVQDFDWMSWNKTEEGSRLLHDPTAIAGADVDQLARLMTAIIRLDRFAEGHLGGCFERGMVLAIAERAEAILRSGTGINGSYQHRSW
jgi:hypothetical protein